MTDSLDANFAALTDAGLTVAAFTAGTDAYVARQAALAAVQGSLGAAWQQATADLAAASCGTPEALLATVDSAGRLAQATAALAALAAA